MRSSRIVLAAIVCLVPLLPVAAQAQVPEPSAGTVDLGVFAGIFSDYPDRLKDACGQDIGTLGIQGGVLLTSQLAIQASTAVGGGINDGQGCPLPGPPIGPGATALRITLDEDLEGAGIFSSDVGVLFDLLPASAGSIHLKGAVGRMWNKKLNYWLLGAGLRYSFGGHAVVLDVERWSFSFDMLREVLLYDENLDFTVVDSSTLREEANPYLFRLGYEIRVR